MKSLIILDLFAHTLAFADGKVRVDVSEFKDATQPSECNVVAWWGENVLTSMRLHIEDSLTNSQKVTIVAAERTVLYRPSFDTNVNVIRRKPSASNSQYSVRGKVQTFNLCQRVVENHSVIKAEVQIELVIIDVKTGQPLDSFTIKTAAAETLKGTTLPFKGAALGSGIFKDSAIGKAMFSALSGASDRIVGHFESVNSDDPGYEIKTMPKTALELETAPEFLLANR